MFDKVLNMSLGSTDIQDSFATSFLETYSEPYETSKLERFANIMTDFAMSQKLWSASRSGIRVRLQIWLLILSKFKRIN